MKAKLRKYRKILVVLSIFGFLAIFSSCSFWDVIAFDEYVTSVSFPKGNIDVYEQGYSSVYLEAEPADAFEYYESEFTIVNTQIAEITRVGDNYCFVHGLKVGSTVLRAELNNKICETIITVLPNK